MTDSHQRHWLAIGALALLAGCDRTVPADGRVTIVSPWTVGECRQIEREFNAWRASEGREAVRVRWVWLPPGEDLERVVTRRAAHASVAPTFDFALGGPASAYRRLEGAGVFGGVTGESLPWWVVRRSPIGVAEDSQSAGPKERGPGLAFDDPRRDAVALAWAASKLSTGAWSEGYAQLVRDARESRRVGRQTGSALAAVDQREAGRAVTTEARASLASMKFAAESGAGEFAEGAAIIPGGSQPPLAAEFLQFLWDRKEAKPPVEAPNDSAAADGLLADLLGATLVDAQDELWAANAALVRAGRPAQLERFLAEAPPWPPASVEELVNKGREDLLETLAGQITPDADVRAWLRRSWLVPGRLVDGALLEEMAQAVDGRLIREPRFRAWLRAEWTAWARQRYRRVARVAQGRWP